MSTQTNFLISTTASVASQDPTALPTFSSSISTATHNTSIGLTVPTLIPNPPSNATSIIPPFINSRVSPPAHPSPVYVIVPVILGFVCVVGLVALCSWIRWKRRHHPEAKGWWSEDQEMGTWRGPGYGGPLEQERERMYEPGFGGKMEWVKGNDNWRRNTRVEERELTPERMEVAVEDESLRSPEAASGIGTMRSSDHATVLDQEATAMLPPDRTVAKGRTTERIERKYGKQGREHQTVDDEYQGPLAPLVQREA